MKTYPIRFAPDRQLFDSFAHDPSLIPVSFSLDGDDYRGFGSFALTGSEESTAKNGVVTRRLTFAIDKNLTAEVLLAYCPEFGELEYTVFFSNTGEERSRVLHDVRTVDLTVCGDDPVLDGIMGDHVNKYRPYRHALVSDPVEFTSLRGRPTHEVFPYYDLEYGDGGVLMALGWAGSWSAKFTTSVTADGTLTRYTAVSGVGFEAFLLPGETVRTALAVFLPYRGRNTDDASNLWRRWFVKYNMPRADASGAPIMPFTTACLAGDTGLPNSDGSISERDFTWRRSLDRIYAEKVPLDFRWFDAGWYLDPRGESVPSDWWGTVGTWELDREKWRGDSFCESVEYAHRHGTKTLVWFEPERVTDPENLEKNFGYKKEWGVACGNVTTNNLGNEECLAWTAGRIIKFMRENHVDLYREDNNSNPFVCWQNADAHEEEIHGAPRRGITENHAVVGHYRLWDSIIDYCRQNGGCTFVDSCAAGGGRNDIESMRRGVPLLRSDSDRTTTALRLSMTTAFNKWIPFCGASSKESTRELAPGCISDIYVFRASYLPALNLSIQWTQKPDVDYDRVRGSIAEWRSVAEYLMKDMYVLTPWHSENDRTGWTATAWFDPERGSGVLLAFRMEDCPDGECTVRLPFAVSGKKYTLANADSGTEETADGSVLSAGYTLRLGAPRTSMLIRIKENDR